MCTPVCRTRAALWGLAIAIVGPWAGSSAHATEAASPAVAAPIAPATPARPGLIVEDRVLELPAPAGSVVVNGSLARLRNMLAVVYRVDSITPSGGQRGQLYMVELDRSLRAVGSPSVLETRLNRQVTPTAEDPRLVEHQGKLFVAYNSTDNGEVSKTQRDMYLLEVGIYRGASHKQFYAVRRKRMLMADHQRLRVEKNWTPFSHDGRLHFVYNTNPPYVGVLDAHDWQAPGPEVTLKLAGKDDVRVADPLGTMRGGSPAVWVERRGEFVSFHHTFLLVGQKNHRRRKAPYTALYMAGAYGFERAPPFSIQHVSYIPIVPPSAHEELTLQDEGRKMGWINYPTGVLYEPEQHRYYVSYSQNDMQVRLMTIDGTALDAMMNPAANEDDLRR